MTPSCIVGITNAAVSASSYILTLFYFKIVLYVCFVMLTLKCFGAVFAEYGICMFAVILHIAFCTKPRSCIILRLHIASKSHQDFLSNIFIHNIFFSFYTTPTPLFSIKPILLCLYFQSSFLLALVLAWHRCCVQVQNQ